MSSILIVDDDPNIGRIFRRILAEAGYQVRTAGSAAEALREVREGEPDLIFLDFQLPDANGLALMRSLREAGCGSQVIMITGYESVRTAVAAMKAGAYDYLAKPVDNEEILLTARRALEVTRLREQVAECRATITRLRAAGGIVGGSRALHAALAAAERAAGSEINVLVTGESGVGKDLIAHFIHERSARREAPFVVVDCGSLPEALAESEVFGHERGAFTGAAERRAGRFALAHGGTLFLDEIGNAPLPLQAKLLRAIETKTFDRLGGRAPVHADVRIVAATNRDLRALVGSGGFREDLYYRLGGFPIAVPPLRERREDIPELARHFAAALAAQQHREAPPAITPAALAALEGHRWPGNVRELRNVIERAVLLADAAIAPEHLPAELTRAATAAGTPAVAEMKARRGEAAAEVERGALVEALALFRGNKRAVARHLAVTPRTLYRLLRKHGLLAGEEAAPAG